MSKFYTFDELKEEMPTAEAVSHARDAALQFIGSLGRDQERVVMYGSVMWGAHPKIGDQHGRRSDIDIAITEGALYSGKHELIERVKTFCSELEAVTNVPMGVSVLGLDCRYECFISPSTADHFRLLANRFRGMHHSRFLGLTRLSQERRVDRVDDFGDYVRTVRGSLEYLIERGKNLDLRDPAILGQLSKLENFPDHIIRKLLGREKILPCPDSKQNIRRVFSEYSPKWSIRDKILPIFQRMFSSSQEYESLIDSVAKGMAEEEYYQRFNNIAKNMIATGRDIFNGLEGVIYGSTNMIRSVIDIVRIERGKPVIILTHYGDGKGNVEIEKLESSFRSPENEICYCLGYAVRPIFATKGKRLISGYEKTDLLVYSRDRAEKIQDPEEPGGWINYKLKDNWGATGSIKPCDEALLIQFKKETDEDSVKPAVSSRVKKRYYEQFAKEANPEKPF